VPRETCWVEWGRGIRLRSRPLNEGRIAIGAQMIGAGRAARSIHAVAYARQRKQFARPSANFRACSSNWPACNRRWKARAPVYNAARLRDAGMPFLTSSHGEVL